jgi:muconolactone delta-isomerase
MPHYMVTIDLIKDDPLLNIRSLTDIVTEKILPSLEALKALQSKGKVLAGGHPVGQRFLLLIMEAESEEEAQKLLEELPLYELGNTKVTELRGFEGLWGFGKRA